MPLAQLDAQPRPSFPQGGALPAVRSVTLSSKNLLALNAAEVAAPSRQPTSAAVNAAEVAALSRQPTSATLALSRQPTSAALADSEVVQSPEALRAWEAQLRQREAKLKTKEQELRDREERLDEREEGLERKAEELGDFEHSKEHEAAIRSKVGKADEVDMRSGGGGALGGDGGAFGGAGCVNSRRST